MKLLYFTCGLDECETCSPTFREERRLWLFKVRVLRRIFAWTQRSEEKLEAMNNEKLHNS
jgi:hypothetical protein